MKRAFLIIASTGVLAAASFAGCKSDPCVSVADRAKECYIKTHGKKPEQTEYARFTEVCRTAPAKFDKCMKLKDCAAFAECVSKAGTDPKAKQEYEAKMKQKKAEPAPAPAMAPAPAPMDAMAPAMAPAPAPMDAMAPSKKDAMAKK